MINSILDFIPSGSWASFFFVLANRMHKLLGAMLFNELQNLVHPEIRTSGEVLNQLGDLNGNLVNICEQPIRVQ